MGFKRTITLTSALTLTLSFGIALGGCMGDEEVGKVEAALASPGPWDIPASTIAAGDTQYVSYTGAGRWTGTGSCSGGITSGAQEVREWLQGAFPQIRSIGGYSCRHINGDSSTMSVHATGRALDIMLPLHSGEADNDLGDPIGNWLIEHAEEIGIQYIIWDRWTWNASRSAGSKERSYGGAHPHHDHLHVELSVAASRGETAWFSGTREPPALEDCDMIAASGGTVDDTSPCFSAFGSAAYWRPVTGAGEGGSLIWTNAFQNDNPSNWARWHLQVAAAGEYAVEVAVDPTWGVYAQTRYSVYHDGREDVVTADQSASTGWIRLGVYDFAAGGGQHVSVYDNTTGAVAAEQHIVADAVRLVPASPGMEPDPTVDPVEPPPEPETPPVVDGGDPTIDDDPMPTEPGADPGVYGAAHSGAGEVSGGCSATGSRGDSGAALALATIAMLLVSRRRRR